MSKLIDLLAPSQSANMHTVVADLIKGIISMAAPSPAAGLGDGMSNGPASNRFARELAHRDSVTKLTGYILSEYPIPPPPPPPAPAIPSFVAKMTPAERIEYERMQQADQPPPTPAPSILPLEDDDEYGPPSYPNAESTTSSVVQSICIIIELIRQNNSDYFEPYLFHTLRNRLIHVQQQLQMHTQDGRAALEQAMKDMVNRMGVVHLGPVLDIMTEKLEDLQKYLRKPRSLVSCSRITHTVAFAECRRASVSLSASIEWSGLNDRRGIDTANVRAVPNMRTLCRTAPLLEYVSSQPTY